MAVDLVLVTTGGVVTAAGTNGPTRAHARKATRGRIVKVCLMDADLTIKN